MSLPRRLFSESLAYFLQDGPIYKQRLLLISMSSSTLECHVATNSIKKTLDLGSHCNWTSQHKLLRDIMVCEPQMSDVDDLDPVFLSSTSHKMMISMTVDAKIIHSLWSNLPVALSERRSSIYPDGILLRCLSSRLSCTEQGCKKLCHFNRIVKSSFEIQGWKGSKNGRSLRRYMMSLAGYPYFRYYLVSFTKHETRP